MLPTHFVQNSSSDPAPDPDSTMNSPSSVQHRYPPANANANSIPSRRKRSDSKSHSHWFKLTDLTVTTEISPETKSTSQPESTWTSTSSSNTTNPITPKPSRWRTPEFIFYLIVVFLAVSLMTWVPVDISNDRNPQYYKFANHLKKGWLFGRKRDDSDFQYRSFRDYVGLLTLIMFLYLSMSKLVSSLPPISNRRGPNDYRPLSRPSPNSNPDTPSIHNRKPFLLGFIAIFLLALHGSNSLKILTLLYINYLLAKNSRGTVLGPVLIWSFNCAVLASVHWNDGFAWRSFLPPLGFLDDFTGLLPRWQINFNISMLRLVSFGLDWHWATVESSSTNTTTTATATANNQESLSQPESNPRKRCSISRPLDQYSFWNCLIYVLYPPLFIAGPIMTFNDFTSQLYRPLPFSKIPVIKYAIRVASSMLVMELILHFIWVNAMKDSKAWNGLSPLQLSMVGFWNLIIVWLKLLIPWRFFRLWALSDGVEAPENMIRCMANNYSTLGFWRSWHRSYNLWIVRYIYIPLGGAKNPIPSTLLVFTFVALWHDLSFKLLYWGWLVTFFVLPEMVARKLVPEKKFGSFTWYRHLSAVGGVANVLMMMTANLVGFAIGVDGVKYMWEQILGSWQGIQFMIGTCGVLFTGVQVMFEYREEELRNGISRKC